MRKLILEISAELIEHGFKTGNTVRHTVVSKGLPADAKLAGAGINTYGNLELHFTIEKQDGDDKHVSVEFTTMVDA